MAQVKRLAVEPVRRVTEPGEQLEHLGEISPGIVGGFERLHLDDGMPSPEGLDRAAHGLELVVPA